ncbi:putative leader peptide [Kribbella caucasensis]
MNVYRPGSNTSGPRHATTCHDPAMTSDIRLVARRHIDLMRVASAGC